MRHKQCGESETLDVPSVTHENNTSATKMPNHQDAEQTTSPPTPTPDGKVPDLGKFNRHLTNIGKKIIECRKLPKIVLGVKKKDEPKAAIERRPASPGAPLETLNHIFNCKHVQKNWGKQNGTLRSKVKVLLGNTQQKVTPLQRVSRRINNAGPQMQRGQPFNVYHTRSNTRAPRVPFNVYHTGSNTRAPKVNAGTLSTCTTQGQTRGRPETTSTCTTQGETRGPQNQRGTP